MRPVRTRQVFTKTFNDILYDNYRVAQSLMKADIDMYVKTNFTTNGMVDDVSLSRYVFDDNISPDLGDKGHQKVFGYIIAKYCEMSNPDVKAFLRQIAEAGKLDILKSFGVTPVLRGNAYHFRKMTDYVC